MTQLAMTILDALADPALFGSLPAFNDLSTWRPWLAWIRAVYGLPMDATDLELFRKHTGRQQPRIGGYPEAVCIVGCQSGKSLIAALVELPSGVGVIDQVGRKFMKVIPTPRPGRPPGG